MMRGGVPWLLHEFPDVVDQKIVKSADLFLENFIGLHYRSQIAIVDAVKWIELNGVTLEMPGQEGLCYFLMPHVVPAGALYVIEEHREMRHVKTVGQHVELERINFFQTPVASRHFAISWIKGHLMVTSFYLQG